MKERGRGGRELVAVKVMAQLAIQLMLVPLRTLFWGPGVYAIEPSSEGCPQQLLVQRCPRGGDVLFGVWCGAARAAESWGELLAPWW